jgi:hypothetical protein
MVSSNVSPWEFNLAGSVPRLRLLIRPFRARNWSFRGTGFRTLGKSLPWRSAARHNNFTRSSPAGNVVLVG